MWRARSPDWTADAAPARLSAAQGTGPGNCARVTTKTYSDDERGGKLSHGRKCNCRHRQRPGALCDLFSVERVANTPRGSGEQGFGKAESRACGANRSGASVASVHGGGL